MRASGTFVFASLALLFTGLLLIVGIAYPAHSGLMPLLVGLFTVLVLSIILVGEYYPAVTLWGETSLGESWGKGQEREEKASEFTSWAPVLEILGWVALFFGWIYCLGFWIAAPFFNMAFLIRKAEMAWYKALAIGLIASGLIYVIMYLLLDLELWPGVIPELIPDILGGARPPPF